MSIVFPMHVTKKNPHPPHYYKNASGISLSVPEKFIKSTFKKHLSEKFYKKNIQPLKESSSLYNRTCATLLSSTSPLTINSILSVVNRVLHDRITIKKNNCNINYCPTLKVFDIKIPNREDSIVRVVLTDAIKEQWKEWKKNLDNNKQTDMTKILELSKYKFRETIETIRVHNHYNTLLPHDIIDTIFAYLPLSQETRDAIEGCENEYWAYKVFDSFVLPNAQYLSHKNYVFLGDSFPPFIYLDQNPTELINYNKD